MFAFVYGRNNCSLLLSLFLSFAIVQPKPLRQQECILQTTVSVAAQQCSFINKFVSVTNSTIGWSDFSLCSGLTALLSYGIEKNLMGILCPVFSRIHEQEYCDVNYYVLESTNLVIHFDSLKLPVGYNDALHTLSSLKEDTCNITCGKAKSILCLALINLGKILPRGNNLTLIQNKHKQKRQVLKDQQNNLYAKPQDLLKPDYTKEPPSQGHELVDSLGESPEYKPITQGGSSFEDTIKVENHQPASQNHAMNSDKEFKVFHESKPYRDHSFNDNNHPKHLSQSKTEFIDNNILPRPLDNSYDTDHHSASISQSELHKIEGDSSHSSDDTIQRKSHNILGNDNQDVIIDVVNENSESTTTEVSQETLKLKSNTRQFIVSTAQSTDSAVAKESSTTINEPSGDSHHSASSEAYYKGYGSWHFLSIFVFIMAFATFGYFVFHNRRKVHKLLISKDPKKRSYQPL